MKKFQITFLVLAALSRPSTAAIETVIAPTLSNDSVEILRWSLFRDGDKVKYGQCDTLEPECSPDVPSLVVTREIGYPEFLNALALRFRIPAKYLAQHDAAIASYQAYSATLASIRDNKSLRDEERESAGQKLEILTSRGGILDRFLQAVAMKRSLEWAKDGEQAQQLTTGFAGTGKLASLVVNSPDAGNKAGNFRDFLTFLSDHGDAAEEVRGKAKRLRHELNRLETSGPDVARSLDSKFKVLMNGGRAARKQCEELDTYLTGIPSISTALGGTVSEAYAQFEPHLGSYRTSLEDAAKNGLDEAPKVLTKQVITYEKSVRQFEQALWPMNFAPSKTPGDPTKIEEPSTGKTWVFIGNNLTYTEAVDGCHKYGHGFGLPELEYELTYSAPWLVQSVLAGQIAGKGEKRVWVRGQIISNGRSVGQQLRQVSVGYRTTAERMVNVQNYDYSFPQAVLLARPIPTGSWVTSKGEEAFSSEKAEAEFGNVTHRAPALCVGPTKLVPIQ